MNKKLILISVVAAMVATSITSCGIKDEEHTGKTEASTINTNSFMTTISQSQIPLIESTYQNFDFGYTIPFNVTLEEMVNTKFVTDAELKIETVSTPVDASNVATISATKTENVNIETQRPMFDNVSLSEDLQEYIWNLCEKDIETYKIALSIAYVESKFDVNIKKSPTNDYGLFQINAAHLDPNEWDNLPDLLGIKHKPYSKYTPEEISQMGVHRIIKLKNYWAKQEGLTNEQRYIATLLQYNRGETGGKRYIKRKGYNKHDDYVTKVTNFKNRLDKESGK